MLVEWNETAAAYPSEQCLHELFAAQAARTPDAVAVVYEDQQLSYGELDRRSNQLAHHLRGLGVGPEVVVGLCVERSLEMVVGLLGILKAGGAYLPLDPSYPRGAARPTCWRMRGAGRGDAGAVWWSSCRAHDGAAGAARCRLGGDRAAARTLPCDGTVPEQSRLRDLHLRLDRQAQGGDGRTSRGGQLR